MGDEALDADADDAREGGCRKLKVVSGRADNAKAEAAEANDPPSAYVGGETPA